MVASVFGSESRDITYQPADAKAEPTEPVPEKSSSKRIYTCKIEKHLEAFDKNKVKIFIKWFRVSICQNEHMSLSIE